MASDVHTLSPDELLAHSEWLRRLAGALARDSAEAEDLAQEAWEVALDRPPREDGPLRPWLAGVVRNVWRMKRRTAARRVDRERATADERADVPQPEELVARVQMQQLAARCVLELDEPVRTIVLLRYYEGYSAAEIARRLDIPAGTVRWRLKTGLDALRARLDAEHGGDRKQWLALLAPLPGAIQAAGGAGTLAAAAKGVLLMKTVAKVVAVIAVLVAAFFGGRSLGWWGGGGGGEAPVATAPAAAPNGEPRDTAQTAPRARLAVGAAAEARDDDPIGTLRLEGQVVDDNEHGIGGAIVGIDTNPPRTVVAEGDGSFAFDKLIGRTYTLEAHAGDSYAGPAALRLAADTEPVILRARTGGVVRVDVRDAVTDAPIRGAEVELRSSLMQSSLTWSATTGDDGIAELRGVGGWDLPLRVRANGYAPAAVRLIQHGIAPQPVHRRVALERGAPVAGRVVDGAGAPVAGARVIAHATSEPFPIVDPRRDGVVTDGKGRWKLPAVAAGTYRFEATHAEYPAAATAPTRVDGATPRSDLEIEMTAGARLSGAVTTEAGEPVVGADVRVVVQGGVPWRTARSAFTDGEGQFSIIGLPRRPVQVVASHVDGSSPVTPVDLATADDARVELSLSVTGAIAGVVVDSAGRELPEARVVAEPEWSGDPIEHAAWDVRGVQQRIADSSGAFSFHGLPAGQYRLRAARADAGEEAAWLASGTVATPGDTALRLVVPEGGRVTGKVLFDDGTAPPVFTVAIGATSGEPFAGRDGGFDVEAPGGTYRLTVSGPSFVPASQPVTVDGAKGTDVGTITVERGRSVSGRVIDESGAPVEGAEVAAGGLLTGDGTQLYIEDESINARATRTDADGRFLMTGFGDHRLTVVAGKPDVGRSASIAFPRGSASIEVDLVLQATGALEGRVTRGGQPLAETVMIVNPVGAFSSNFFVITGADGRYALDALTAGEYIVYPMIGGGGPKPKDMHVRGITIVAGERATLDIEVTEGKQTLLVDVKTDAGDAVQIAPVFVLGAEVDAATMDAMRDGQWMDLRQSATAIPMYMRMVMGKPARIENIPPGKYTACATPVPMDPDNPMGSMPDRDDISLLPMQCTPVRVKATGAEQTATVVVPAKWVEPNQND